MCMELTLGAQVLSGRFRKIQVVEGLGRFRKAIEGSGRLL